MDFAVIILSTDFVRELFLFQTCVRDKLEKNTKTEINLLKCICNDPISTVKRHKNLNTFGNPRSDPVRPGKDLSLNDWQYYRLQPELLFHFEYGKPAISQRTRFL